MTPPDPPAVRAVRRTLRRAEMVAAAVAAVRRHGAGVSVAEIAAAAGITKPVIYRYFTDRADLQRAVGELAANTLVERIGRQMQRDLGPAARVREMISAFLTCIDEDPELWRFVVHHPAGRAAAGPATEIVAGTRQQIVEMLTGLIGTQLRHHDTDGAEVWAHGLVGMVQSAAEWWMERRTMTRAELTDHLSALAWGGIATDLPGSDLPGPDLPGPQPPNSDPHDSRASDPAPRGTP